MIHARDENREEWLTGVTGWAKSFRITEAIAQRRTEQAKFERRTDRSAYFLSIIAFLIKTSTSALTPLAFVRFWTFR